MKSKDTIATRVGRIISGSARRVIDILESATPEIVMEQAIEEIDTAIFEVREELGKEEAEKHLANKRLEDATRKHETLSMQINIALDEKREDLAEAAVQRQLDIESQIPVLKTTIEEADGRINELNHYIAALQGKKREMRDELKDWRVSKTISESISNNIPGTTDSDIEAKVARAESAFDRIINRQMPSNGYDAQNAAKLAELEELARKNRTRERLTRIKAERTEE